MLMLLIVACLLCLTEILFYVCVCCKIGLQLTQMRTGIRSPVLSDGREHGSHRHHHLHLSLHLNLLKLQEVEVEVEVKVKGEGEGAGEGEGEEASQSLLAPHRKDGTMWMRMTLGLPSLCLGLLANLGHSW